MFIAGMNAQMDDKKRVYSVDEIAGILCISRSSAYNLVKTQAFTIVRIGRAIRISKASFDEWLHHHSVKECQGYGFDH